MNNGSTAASVEKDAEHHGPSGLDARRALVQRILASPDFMRSPQLSRFLQYICESAFEGRSRSLSEQHIGVAVFGREPDYDSSADTIVRSHALRLRRRLEQYFQRAGRNESLRLTIPKGTYIPSFEFVSVKGTDERETGIPAGHANILSSEPVDSAQVEASAARPPVADVSHAGDSVIVVSRIARLTSTIWRYRVLTGCLLLLFGVICAAFGLHLRTHLQATRRHVLWGRLFTNDQPTRIVLGDSGLVLFHAFARKYVSLHDYLNNDYSRQIPYLTINPKSADFLLHRRYTSVVDATTLAHLIRLPEAAPERTLVQYSRDMHIEDFNSSNVIMIGAEEAVPWVELFEKHMDFVFSIDHPDTHSSFVNRHPKPGEMAEYDSKSPSKKSKAYGVVAFLPNLSGNGNVLIVEGLTMVGTEAAINLVLDDQRILPVLQGIRRQDGSLPHFEMLVESDMLGDGAGPARVVSIHLHD